MIRFRQFSIVIALALGSLGLSSSALAQVIQLPSFRTFSYSGSVLVPDSGSAYLGGVNRSAASSQRRGFGRSFGQSASTSGAVVSATIIDLDEMDRAIRATDIRKAEAQRELQAAKAQAEGKQLVRFARSQYRAGKLSSSRNAYQVAISVLDGQLKQLAIAEYKRLFDPYL